MRRQLSEESAYNAGDGGSNSKLARRKVAWKRVHGDVFRKPQNFMAFAVLVGTGVQVSFMVGTAIMCATLGG